MPFVSHIGPDKRLWYDFLDLGRRDTLMETQATTQSLQAATHIQLDEKGVAWIDNTRVKVIEVVLDKLAHGSSPEELHFQYPHLSLSQIHAALAYYYDHQVELDADIE